MILTATNTQMLFIATNTQMLFIAMNALMIFTNGNGISDKQITSVNSYRKKLFVN
jgi:hypothetical protein